MGVYSYMHGDDGSLFFLEIVCMNVMSFQLKPFLLASGCQPGENSWTARTHAKS